MMRSRALDKKWQMILLLSAAELLVMVVWFSASAVVPMLTEVWSLDANEQAWLTMSVQIGFVVGAVGSAVLTLADRIPATWFFVGSSFAAAGVTALIPLLATTPLVTIGLRFLTGVFLAGVYPVGMKIMATWTQEDRGLGIGLLVGALTVGSAMPHLLNVAGGMQDWRRVLWLAAGSAMVGGLIAFFFLRTGPFTQPSPKFHFGDIRHILTDRRVMLANMGYLGHMWELYAMWSWLGVFLVASFTISGTSSEWAGLLTFAAISAGGVGSVLAGKVADRIGRVTVTIVSMCISGVCALLVGLFFGGNPILLAIVVLIWGFFIVADSAQFSASVSELADKRFIGTALTLQTSMGFLLTMVSIRLTPLVEQVIGWRWAFAFLALGPVMGIWAMWQLGKHAEREYPPAKPVSGGK